MNQPLSFFYSLENFDHQNEHTEILPSQPQHNNFPLSQRAPDPLPDYTEPSPPLENNFTIVRFILCWTGLACEISGCTCKSKVMF